MPLDELEFQAEVRAHFQQLGRPTSCYRASKSRVAMGLFAAAIGIFFGCYTIWMAQTGSFGADPKPRRRLGPPPEVKTSDKLGGFALGAVLILGSAAFAWWVLSLTKRRIVVCAEGVIDFCGAKIQCLPWDEVELLDLTAIRNSAFKGVAGQLVKTTEYAYTVLARDGRAIRFNRDKVAKSVELFDVLRTAAEQRGIPVNEH